MPREQNIWPDQLAQLGDVVSQRRSGGPRRGLAPKPVEEWCLSIGLLPAGAGESPAALAASSGAPR